MNNNTRVFFNCLGLAVLTLLIGNGIAFLVEYLQTDRTGDWVFQFDKGAFYINGESVGLVWGEMKTILFLFLAFGFYLFKNYSSGNFKL